MYRKTPFRVALLEDVEADLKELHDRGEKITRIYLTNGDPFVLNTDRLVKIAEQWNKSWLLKYIQFIKEKRNKSCQT